MTVDDSYDVIVVGVGGMGSATVFHLAKRGYDVLGLEKFDIPHNRGSSHGLTRLIRLAYFENPWYVPLVKRAYQLWQALEDRSGWDILYPVGAIDIGPSDSDLVTGAKEACDEHGLTHETLSGKEVSDRFPGFSLPSNYSAVYQSQGGFLVPERGIVAHVRAAQDHDGEIHGHEPVEDWYSTSGGICLETAQASYRADTLVVTCGAWAGKLLPEISEKIVPSRITVGWFEPSVNAFSQERFPVFNLAGQSGEFYGTPEFRIPGFKIGRVDDTPNEIDPSEFKQDPTQQEEQQLREAATRYLAYEDGPTMRLDTCMVTHSPDGHFILDSTLDHSNVLVGAGFSGHGFKFCPVVGEILADLVESGTTSHDISKFRIDRLF